MGISFNTRTEAVSQGRILRLWRTKNKSGSICSVIYLVYLKHATGPTFLNLWNRIQRSPETRTKNPHWGLSPDNKKGCIFHTVWHVTSCFHRDSPYLPPPPIFQAQIRSSSTQHWDPVPSAQKGSSFPSRTTPTTTDLLRFGICVQEALILGNN